MCDRERVLKEHCKFIEAAFAIVNTVIFHVNVSCDNC